MMNGFAFNERTLKKSIISDALNVLRLQNYKRVLRCTWNAKTAGVVLIYGTAEVTIRVKINCQKYIAVYNRLH